jgi:hypothetical protein
MWVFLCPRYLRKWLHPYQPGRLPPVNPDHPSRDYKIISVGILKILRL